MCPKFELLLILNLRGQTQQTDRETDRQTVGQTDGRSSHWEGGIPAVVYHFRTWQSTLEPPQTSRSHAVEVLTCCVTGPTAAHGNSTAIIPYPDASIGVKVSHGPGPGFV